MGILNPIFLDTDESKSTTIPMPDATADWPDFLINELYKQHPGLSGKSAKANFQAEEKEQGYAVGSIEIRSNGMVQLHVPFIVEGKKLYPFDVYFPVDNKKDPMPLNADRIREALFQMRILDGLAPPPRRGSITDISSVGAHEAPADRYVHPPSTMGIAKWSSAHGELDIIKAVGDYLADFKKCDNDLLKEALDNTYRERIESYKKDLMTLDGALAIRKMQSNGTIDGYEKIAEYGEKSPPLAFFKEAEFWDGINLESLRLKKEGANNYTAWVSMSCNPPSLIKMSKVEYGEALKLVETLGHDPEQVMQATERSGEKIISAIRHNPVQHVNLVEELVPENYVKAPSGGPFKVNVYDHKAGGSLKGYLFGDVVYPSGGKTGDKLFVSDDDFAFQRRMAVEVLCGGMAESRVPRIKYDIPEVGQWGTFIRENDDKTEATALVPFKIVKMVRSKGRDTISAETINGNTATFVPSMVVKQLTPFGQLSKEQKDAMGVIGNNRGRIYLIPCDFDYVSLGNRREVADSPEQAMKVATDLRAISVNPIRIISDDGHFFHIRGEAVNDIDFSNAEYNIKQASPAEAIHSLLIAGVDEQSAIRALEKAANSGKSILDHKRKPYELSWSIKEAEAKHVLLKEEVKGVVHNVTQTNLLKMASSIPDSATVNNILALRFIGPETFYYFSSKIPELEKMLSFLCVLLLTSRLDSSIELDEYELSSAVRLVDGVTQKLKKIKSTLVE
jgi:hypothetical protein